MTVDKMPAQLILVIESDEHMRSALQDLLRMHGYHVLLAEDGLVGMEILQKEAIDLLILNIRVPYVNGLALISLAREHVPGLPIICMSSHGHCEEKIIQQENVDRILSHPFDLQELSAAIKELLKKS